MKDFNYNDYLKNNPLLRENSISIEQADEIARQAADFDDAVIQLEDKGMSMQQAEQIASQYHEMSSSSYLNEDDDFSDDITKAKKLQSIINHLQSAQDELNALGEEDDAYEESPYTNMGFDLDKILEELRIELSQIN